MAATLEALLAKPPILHAGECTPAIILDLELAFSNYVIIKKIKQTKTLIGIILQLGWEDDHRITMTARCHFQSESFFTFANAVRSMNSLLVNTDSHLSDERLRNHLESAMCHNLLDNYRANPLAKAVDSTKLCCGSTRSRAQAQQALTPATNNNGGKLKCPCFDGPSNSSAANNGVKQCLPLMDEEMKILDANQGCRH
ncbi:hypothetical protein B0H19DRAFT_1065273 [Mycena capillaripes]|nr:hypothetical protein B0H19DRAFT_1065273 [Mycena capillaripes]